jgi:uncharacterized protein YjiS (DUF1127 family)
MTMSAPFNSSQPVPLGAVSIFRATSGLESIVRAFSAWNRARSTRAALANLSDAQLADIGVTRYEIGTLSGALARR